MKGSRSLFHITSKGSRTDEKQIMLDTCADRQAYKSNEVSNINFLRSMHNVTDGRAKPGVQTELYKLLTRAYNKPKVKQWILRDLL